MQMDVHGDLCIYWSHIAFTDFLTMQLILRSPYAAPNKAQQFYTDLGLCQQC